MDTTTPDGASLLDRIDVTTPCTADWSLMTGDDRRRRCGQCRLDVYDLSAMTRREAEELLEGRAGQRTCVRFARRSDGTVVSADCLTVAARLRRRMHVAAAALVGLLGFGTSWLAGEAAATGGLNTPATWQKQPFKTVGDHLPADWLPDEPQILMGDICIVAPPPASGAATGTPDGGDDVIEDDVDVR